MSNVMTFDYLAKNIKNIHEATSSYAKGAVNQLLTIRNWVIGYYIVEFEQNGQERAKYGENLLKDLATRLNIKGLEHKQLYVCRMFYSRYPQIFSTVSRKFIYYMLNLLNQKQLKSYLLKEAKEMGI